MGTKTGSGTVNLGLIVRRGVGPSGNIVTWELWAAQGRGGGGGVGGGGGGGGGGEEAMVSFLQQLRSL